jgi:putative hydrolase of the HAD superfamily
MKKYKHLFFDFDNTLWDFSTNSKESLKEVYEKYNFQENFKSFDEFFEIYEKKNLKLWNEYRNGDISKETLINQRFAFAAEAKEMRVNPSQLNNDYLTFTTKKTKVLDDAHDLLKYLKDKYLIHIITDGFFEVQIIKLRTSKLSPFITNIITAEEIGRLKPAKELFDYALQHAGATKEEAIVIGDCYETDIIGAHNAGIDQIFLNTKNVSDLPVKPTYIVKSLKEIMNIL